MYYKNQIIIQQFKLDKVINDNYLNIIHNPNGFSCLITISELSCQYP